MSDLSVLTERSIDLIPCQPNVISSMPGQDFPLDDSIVKLLGSFSHLSHDDSIQNIIGNLLTPLPRNMEHYRDYILFLLNICKGLSLSELKSQYIAKRIIIALLKIMDTIRITCIDLNFLNIFFTYKGKYYTFYNEASFTPDPKVFPSLKEEFNIDESSIVFIELYALSGHANMEKILERIQNLCKKMKYMPNNEMFVNNLIGFLCHIFTILEDSPLKEKFNSILSEFIELNKRGDRLFNHEQLIILNEMIRPNAINGGAAVADLGQIDWEALANELKSNVPHYKIRLFIANVGIQFANLRALLEHPKNKRLHQKYISQIDTIDTIDDYLLQMFQKDRYDRDLTLSYKEPHKKEVKLKMQQVINAMKDIGDELNRVGINTSNMSDYIEQANTFLGSLKSLDLSKSLPPKHKDFRQIKWVVPASSALASSASALSAPDSGVASMETSEIPILDRITRNAKKFQIIIDRLIKYFEDTVQGATAPTSDGGASAAVATIARKNCDPLIKLTDRQVKILTTQEYRHFLLENLDKANLKNFQIDCEEFVCEPRRPGAGAGAGAAEVIPDEQIEQISRQLQQYDYLLAYLKEIIKNEKPEIDFTIYHCSHANPCINLVFHFDPYDENLSVLDTIARAVKPLIPEANLQPGMAAAMNESKEGVHIPNKSEQLQLTSRGRDNGDGGGGGIQQFKSKLNEYVARYNDANKEIQKNLSIYLKDASPDSIKLRRINEPYIQSMKQITEALEKFGYKNGIHYQITETGMKSMILGGSKSYKNETYKKIKISNTTNKNNKMKTLKLLKIKKKLI